ncbi:hypothetical protein [Niveispirillum fermenti]|uniref:hypothetical protein n=1 Tax=Niveispirillum fermenti TaxID=1233113 RepID=UPI003A8894DD
MPTEPASRRYMRHQSIWLADDGWSVEVVDQARLPAEWVTRRLCSPGDVLSAMSGGSLQGPGLIAVAAAYALALAARRDPDMVPVMTAWHALAALDPRCPRLRGVLDRMREVLDVTPPADRSVRAYDEANAIAMEDLAANLAIGRHAMGLLRRIGAGGGGGLPQTVLLLSEPGWLSGVGWGTASAGLFLAQEQVDLRQATGGVLGEDVAPPHVVTIGPLAAWEMVEAGIPHSPCDMEGAADLIRRQVVERVLVAALRAVPRGDSLVPAGMGGLVRLARAGGIPVHVCLPAAAINWQGLTMAPVPGLDILPLSLIDGFVTDRGTCPPAVGALSERFPDHEPVHGTDTSAANDA